MPTSVVSVLPTSLGVALQFRPRDSQQEGLLSLRGLGRMADKKANTKARKGAFCPPAAEDNSVAALRWPAPSRRLGTLRTVPYVAWSDYIEELNPYKRTASLPMWSAGLDTQDEDSSVSSGRLSGSSGGHESYAFHGLWKERPRQVLGPQQQPRRRDLRLELLRDKIRAQAHWRNSCVSLGTSLPSSTSCICKASPTVLRRRISKVTKALPAPAHPDSELAGVYAWRKGQALVRQLLGPPPTFPWLQSKVPGVELGAGKKAAIAEDSPVHTWLPRPSCTRSDQQVFEHPPSLASHDQPATIQTAMAILQDLRKQIQAGLELARRPRVGQKFIPSKPKPQILAGKKQQGPQSTRDMQSSLPKSDKVMIEEKYTSLDKAAGFGTKQPWSTLAERESSPQRTWETQGQDTSFLKPVTPPEKLSSSQRPWSALVGQTYPPRAWATQGRDTSFERSESPPEKLSSFSQRPWSALAGQTCPQRAWEVHDDRKVPGPRSWSPLERPRPALQRPGSTSFVHRSSLHCKGSNAEPPPPKVKQAWVRPAQGFSGNPPGKQKDTQQSPPCPRLRKALGQPYSSESLRDFMRQKARARQRQALEQKALAARTQELRNQRLQEVYRKQREAVLGKLDPVISQRRPGIVTFVPSSAQSGELEAPGSLKSPVQEWSKVTSGMVVGDQEAPDSFCLCLNRAWNHAETLDTRCSPDGYKKARLKALESMANILRKRIDLLTAKLRNSVSPDWTGDLASDVLPLGSSTVSPTSTFAATTCPRALVLNGDRKMPQDWMDLHAKPLSTTYLLDGETLPWSPSWESQSLSLGAHLKSQPQGVVKDRPWELEKRCKREAAALQALSACTRSSLEVSTAPESTHDSLWLEEMPEARGAGLVMPWTTRSCGQQKPGGPCSGGLHAGHLDDFQLKSLSFLETLKLDQQKQEQALALLQQRAQQEVWATQMALDELLFKHQLEQRMRRHSRPEKASTPKQVQLCGGPEPTILSPSAVTTRFRSPPPPSGREITSSFQHLEETKASGAGKAISTDLGQQVLAKLHPSDGPTYQRITTKPGPDVEESTAFHRFSIAMLEQSQREEELRAQHQAALLRLRELALEEKARSELTWLEHQRGCLGNNKVIQAALLERQHQAVSKLKKEWREIQNLKKVHLSLHLGRQQLLQHQQTILEVQKSAACLRQELQARRIQLSPSPSPRVRTAWEGGSEKSQQQRGALYPMASHRLGSPPSYHLQRSSESSEVTRLPSEPQKGTSPQTTLDADKHRQPPGVTWGDHTPETGSPLVKNSHVNQEPEKQPRDPALGLLHSSSLDLSGKCLGPTFPVAPAPLRVSPPVFLTQSIKEERSPVAQLRWKEAQELPAGDPLTKPSAASAGERHLASTDSHARSLQGQHRQSPKGEGPCPQEARVAEGVTSQERVESALDVARSPEGKSQEEASWRREACQQEDPDVPSCTQLEAASPAPEEMPPILCPGSSQPAAPLDLGSESAPSTCSEAPASRPASSAGLESSLSCSSLQEFQKATATLVQLSDSSSSPSSLEAEVTLDINSRWSREFSADISWEESGPPSSWGLHLGHPQPGGVSKDVGQVTWQRMEDSRAGSLCDSLEMVAMAGDPEPGHSLLWTGWSLPLPDTPSPRLGSELSETSSRIWDEDIEENFLEPGPHVDPASGISLPVDGTSNLESSREPCVAHPFTDPREDQEVSRTSRNLTSVSNSGQNNQVSPAVACTMLPPQTPSTSDLDLSLSSDTSTSEVVGFSKGDWPAQTLAGCQERSQGANPGLSTERNSLQASLEPQTPTTLQFPPKAPSGAKSPEAGSEGDRTLLVMKAASPPCMSGFLTELLSPVDEELSYGSGDLPSSTHRDPNLPPPPPIPQSKSDINESNLSSEDFPSPPDEAMLLGSSLSALGEDTSTTAEDVSSLSEEVLAEAPSPGLQGSGLCLRAPSQDGNLDGRRGDSSSAVMSQAEDGQWSEPAIWPASLLSKEIDSDPSAQPPTVSPVACMARHGLPMALVAGDTDVLLGTQWGSWKGVQCFEGAECQPETGHILDKRASTPSPVCPAAPKVPPPGEAPLVVSGHAGSLGHTSEEEGVLSLWAKDQPKVQDSTGREQLPETDWAADLTSRGCANLPGLGGAGPVDVVSTKLSRKILCDSLAALSSMVPGGSP